MCFLKSAVLFITGLSLCLANEQINCNEEAEKILDQKALELSLFGDPNGKHPLSIEELTAACRIDRQNLKWIRSYSNQCLNGIAYEVVALVIKDMENYLRKYCDSPKLSKILVTWSKCGNAAKNDTMACFKDYVIDLERIVANKKRIRPHDNIPLICCNYFRFDHCAEESFRKPGESLCSVGSVEGLHSMITDVLSTSVEFLCGDYKADNDKCDSVNDRHQNLKNVTINNPRKTPVLPFIQIITNYPQLLEMRNSSTSEEVTKTTTSISV